MIRTEFCTAYQGSSIVLACDVSNPLSAITLGHSKGNEVVLMLVVEVVVVEANEVVDVALVEVVIVELAPAPFASRSVTSSVSNPAKLVLRLILMTANKPE